MNCSHGFKPVNGELKCFCPEGQQPQQNICVGKLNSRSLAKYCELIHFVLLICNYFIFGRFH